MILNGLFSQIIVAVVAVGIMVTYVRPTLTDIGDLQSSIATYREETSKVDDVNAQLSALVADADQLSTEDRRALRTFLPDSVDAVAIPRDIKFIADEAGVFLRRASYQGESLDFFAGLEDKEVRPRAHGFNVQLEGTYEQVKEFIALTEQNNYPLQINTMNLSGAENGFINANFTLVTFTYRPEGDDA